ncbi:hypothetical protein ACEPPN_014401 [Leptodophora sp. 'Broadleaf-Isolate-01']
MASEKTLLQLLQSRSIVDCDTMDVEVPKALGPFVDCTSNQAIAYNELQKPSHKSRIEDAIAIAKKLASKYPELSTAELAVEIVNVIEQSHFWDVVMLMTDDVGIVELFRYLDSSFDHNRVCIKIPSTWEGLQACRILEASKTTTLATTLFTIEQASLAGEVGCHYIAPYVNELKVHFEAGFIDHNKAQKLCVQAQRLYEANGIKTQVLPASLTSTTEIMELAGVHHITISPGLLQELATTRASSNTTVSLFDEGVLTADVPSFVKYADDQAAYRIAFTRSNGGDGEGERKLVQAINTFCNMQDKMEEMMK